MNMYFKYIVVVMLLLITSCVSKKDIIYFQNSNNENVEKFNQDYQKNAPTIEPFDKLSIVINSLKYSEDNSEKDLTAKYNLEHSLSNTAKSSPIFYEVNNKGEIYIPNIGVYEIAGKNRFQVISELKEKIYTSICAELSKNKNCKNILQLDDIVVNIRYENFRINILGEVTKPGVYTLSNEKTSIMEALAMASDLTIQGKRNNVKLVREKNETIEVKYLNLNDANILASEYYYLKQNDIVYVEPNKSKIQSSEFNYTSFISLAGLVIAVVSILLK